MGLCLSYNSQCTQVRHARKEVRLCFNKLCEVSVSKKEGGERERGGREREKKREGEIERERQRRKEKKRAKERDSVHRCDMQEKKGDLASLRYVR
jgi:hypothetical protein